ncbi:MAG: TonB-dependent receptor [Desulfobacteraceae bacterium]|jgi:iron complex outermembrane receptor protein
MRKLKRKLFMMIVFLCVLLCSSLAFSAEEKEGDSDDVMLEEVVVTADKSPEDLQKTSISVTAISGDHIQDYGLVSADEALKDIPNLVVQGAARGTSIAIRGIGSDLPPGMGESSVSTNFNGVYNFRAEAGTLGYYDLERVEVLRGPQGTLYGRNATAGVVNVVTKDPTELLEGYVSLEHGEYDLMRQEAAVNAPISDNWATRVSFVNIDRAGFLSNGAQDAVGSSGRVKLRYKPGDAFKVVLSSEYTKLGGRGPGFVSQEDYDSGDAYTSTYGENTSQDYKSYKHSANIEFDAGPGVVTFIPAYQWGAGEVWGEMNNNLEKSWDPDNVDQMSAELRYGSKSDASVKWVAGLYYYSLTNTTRGDPEGMRPDTITDETTSYAAFGQVTVPFTESFRGIIGARGAKDEKSYDNPNLVGIPTTGDVDWTKYNWKAGLELDLVEDIMSYLTVATGHRPGGFNTMDDGSTFDPEELISYELGVKSRFLNDRLQVNGDVFYYDYENFQLSDFYFVDPSDVFPTLEITNVEEVTTYGAELEIEALITEQTLLSLAGAYLNSTYQSDFVLHDGPTEVSMKDEPLPHAPEYTVKASLSHKFILSGGSKWTPRVSARWTDDQYVAPLTGENQLQEAHTIVDASLVWDSADGKLSLNFYGRNLTDEATKTAFFAGEYLVGSPRQLGALLTCRF